jgi:integrase
MPNASPTKRAAKARPVTLPPGIDPWPRGGYRYRYTEHGARVVKYGATPEECLRKRYEPAPDRSRIVVDERTTLAEYLGLWVAGLALRPNSIATHRGHVERYLVPAFGTELRLAELSREVVKLKLAELRGMTTRHGTPLAPQTVALAYATLRLALNAAVDDRRIPYNPALRLKPNGTTGSRARGARIGLEHPIPTELEVRRIRGALAGDRLEPLYVLTTMTGLRQSEVLGLSWGDIEAGAPAHLRVSRGLRRHDRVLDDPKNGSSARFVPIGPVARELLEERRRAQRLERLAAGERWANPDDLVFTKPDGRPLVGSTVSHWIADACARVELDYGFHDLRHFYASRLINAGVPIAVVSKLLGHANVTITSSTYHHLLKSDDTGSAAIAERAFG